MTEHRRRQTVIWSVLIAASVLLGLGIATLAGPLVEQYRVTRAAEGYYTQHGHRADGTACQQDSAWREAPAFYTCRSTGAPPLDVKVTDGRIEIGEAPTSMG